DWNWEKAQKDLKLLSELVGFRFRPYHEPILNPIDQLKPNPNYPDSSKLVDNGEGLEPQILIMINLSLGLHSFYLTICLDSNQTCSF
ncbi:hypothetical protein MJO28_015195, partial [Puccinia striiformis f. sp. tritici]